VGRRLQGALELSGLQAIRWKAGRLLGGLKLTDKHLASRIHCVDDEIIGWLKRREKRRRDRLACSWQSAYKYLP
jgi:hypothetical protein